MSLWIRNAAPMTLSTNKVINRRPEVRKTPVSESETIALADKFTGHSVTVTRSDAVLPAVSESGKCAGFPVATYLSASIIPGWSR